MDTLGTVTNLRNYSIFAVCPYCALRKNNLVINDNDKNNLRIFYGLSSTDGEW